MTSTPERKIAVPEGQTPLDEKLRHRLLDVIREGEAARDSGAGSPYHGHSLEHCLHATGWVSRDLRLALDKANARIYKLETEARSGTAMIEGQRWYRADTVAGMVAAERERCAAICEYGDYDSEMASYGRAFAEIIRNQH